MDKQKDLIPNSTLYSPLIHGKHAKNIPVAVVREGSFIVTAAGPHRKKAFINIVIHEKDRP